MPGCTKTTMGETLLQKEVRPHSVVMIDSKTAQVLGEPVRNRILGLLRHKAMTAEEITRALSASGQKKAVTTIRHHLEALKKAGLIEATKMVEVRGALLKYYSPTILTFEQGPLQRLKEHQRLIRDVELKVLKILKTIHGDKKFVSAFDKSPTPCSMCKTDHNQESASLVVLNYAIANAIVSKEYLELFSFNKEGRLSGAKT